MPVSNVKILSKFAAGIASKCHLQFVFSLKTVLSAFDLNAIQPNLKAETNETFASSHDSNWTNDPCD